MGFSPLFWPWTHSRVALATIFQNVIQEKHKKNSKIQKILKKKKTSSSRNKKESENLSLSVLKNPRKKETEN